MLLLSISAYALLAAAPPVAAEPPSPLPDAATVRPAPPAPSTRVSRPRPILQGPRPRAPISSWFSHDDYPAVALRDRKEGVVRFGLDIDSSGRVTRCDVQASSGSASLDLATCRILRSRGRFTPAVDDRGNPAAGRLGAAIAWHLRGPITDVPSPPDSIALAQQSAPNPTVPVSAPRLPATRGAVPAAGPARAEPARPLQSLIQPDDYPAAALAARQEGRTSYRLAIGPDGRVTGCVVLVSSGSSALDAATCRIIRSRARFSPARDGAGRPISDDYFGEYAWRLPR